MDEKIRYHSDSHDTKIKEIPLESEINTYDSPIDPLSLTDKEKESRKSKIGILSGIYKFIATTIVILTVIFAASELIDFFVSDMDAENILLRRIFGSAATNGSSNILELILEQTFGELPPTSDFPISPPSEESLESTPTSTPETNEENPSQSPSPESSSSPATEEIPISPLIPNGAHPIMSMDLSLISYGSSYINNSTALSPQISSLISAKLKPISRTEGPLVLVIHTHGTESFMPSGATYYFDEGELARSENTNENMISIGAEFVSVLESNGIETVHCTVMHDKESYRESYARSAETIAYYMKKYPSIRYVFDLHRDSVMRSDESLVSAVTYINGERVAQIMPVVGSGFSGYEDNLSFALKLRKAMNDEYGAISRPVCLRTSQYNQSMAPVSLLLEIGTSGNSRDEAIRAVRLTAEAISKLIDEQCSGQ